MGAPFTNRASPELTYSGLGPRQEFVAETESAPFVDNSQLQWAPKLDAETFGAGTDAMRLQAWPQRDFHGGADAREFYSARGRDEAVRHSVEQIDANGWNVTAPTPRAIAPDPRRNPPAESRITSRLSPSRYSFMRPFDRHSARQFNGAHMSMADHRREYDILTMEPVRNARNTYRLPPSPWDSSMTDIPVNADQEFPGPFEALSGTPRSGGAYRL